MIGAFHALFHAAAQVGQCISENGATLGFRLQHIDASETVGAGREAFKKMPEKLLMVVLSENIQHKFVANLHQSLDRPVFGHGHGDAWWTETGLTDPARHHRATAQAFTVALAGRDHIKPATETA